jgi:ribosomal protein L21E
MKKKHKGAREKGKIKLSRMFQKLEPGDRVTVFRELSESGSFPARIQGNTGVVEKKVGRAYMVKIKDLGMEKRYIIKPIHLVKIK